jgi:hypothetical protein
LPTNDPAGVAAIPSYKLDHLQVAFRANVSYRFSMLEQEDHLVPVILVIQDVEGVTVTRLILPTASLPILERIDGQRSVLDIKCAILPSRPEQAPEVERRIETIIQELYKQAAVSLTPLASPTTSETQAETLLLSGEAR